MAPPPILALLAAAPAAVLENKIVPKNEPEVQARPKLPTWKRRWYNRYMWDARPVIWSLQNHPEEWCIRNHDYSHALRLVHVPTQHRFVIRRQDLLALDDGTMEECSCIKRVGQKFTRGQRRQLWWKGVLPWLAWDATHPDTPRRSTWEPAYEHLEGDARWEAHFVH